MQESDAYAKIMSKVGFNSAEFRRACEKVSESLRGRVPVIDSIRAAIRAAIGTAEIVYLPTYRRIELSLGEKPTDETGRRKPSIQSRLGLSKKGFFNTDIQFGLGDISDRLLELNHELLFNSNQGYREISAKIINDLLDGVLERQGELIQELPDKESLEMFFSRLKQGGRRFGYFQEATIPELEKIYQRGGLSGESNKFLTYFLGQLNTVVQATRGIESLVEDFIDHCNGYLSARDLSTELSPDESTVARRPVHDEKRLELDRKDLKVHVVSVAAGRKVPLDSLSSGEKQMISLFSRLYLYAGPKIVLIDEPELSLSIDWQRKILMDVVNAPTCSQVIAITHSPFVFDNELEPFAKALSLKIDSFSQFEPSDDGDQGEEPNV